MGEIESIIAEDHFYDGLNRRIFSHIASRTKKGLIVSPITLKPYLDSDEAFKDIDVPSLLTELSAMAISAYAAKDYATALFDLAIRRQLIDIGNEIRKSRGNIFISQTKGIATIGVLRKIRC